MRDRAIEHAGLDPWEIRAHVKRLGHDPAARLIRQLCDALPMPSRSVGETAPGRVVMVPSIKPLPMTEILEELAEDAQAAVIDEVAEREATLRRNGLDDPARPAFPKPNFGPGVEEGQGDD
jgi:hypothetical protein